MKGQLSFVLLESPFTSVSTVMRGHPSLVSRCTSIYSTVYVTGTETISLLSVLLHQTLITLPFFWLVKVHKHHTLYTIHIHLLLLLIYVFYVTYTRTCIIGYQKQELSSFESVLYMFWLCNKRPRFSLLTVSFIVYLACKNYPVTKKTVDHKCRDHMSSRPPWVVVYLVFCGHSPFEAEWSGQEFPISNRWFTAPSKED